MNIKVREIIKTKRKTIALQITEDADLFVKAPLDIDNKKIMEVISKHIKWIERKKKEIETRVQKFVPKEFVNGESFLYLGRYYKLTIVNDQEEPLKFENGFYLSKKVLDKAKEVFIEWYKNKAAEKILERVQWYAQKSGLEYNKINITNAQKRWGSSSKKNLNFSWRLIMAPLPVIDYVVVHELSHFQEKSHGKAFWNKVKIMMPNYEKYKNWLKENGHLLKL